MITHVCHIVYSFSTGGLENGIVNLINKLPVNEFRHSIICIRYSDPDFVDRIERDDVDIFHLNKPPGKGVFYLFRLRQIVKNLKPNVIHTRNLSTLEAQLICLGIKAKRVHGEHGWDSPNDRFNKKYQFIRRIVRPFIDQYIVLSQESYQYLRHQIKVKPSKIQLIVNGVDREKFHHRTKVAKPVMSMITIGRLAAVKNFQLQLDALAKLVYEDNVSNVHLTIVGDGALKSLLLAHIEQLKLSDFCSMIGNRSDIAELLNQSNIFILSSTAEGVSNTILEAMSTGTAVIATDVGANRDLVEHGKTGIIVPSNDIMAMSEAMKNYVDEPQECRLHGEQGRVRVDHLFSIERMVEQYAAIYRSCTVV